MGPAQNLQTMRCVLQVLTVLDSMTGHRQAQRAHVVLLPLRLVHIPVEPLDHPSKVTVEARREDDGTGTVRWVRRWSSLVWDVSHKRTEANAIGRSLS